MSFHDDLTSAEFNAEVALAGVLSEFWRDALHNCMAIAEYQPDLLIGLAHGGSTPTRATVHLWQRLMRSPAPPVLYTNLGSEKLVRYQAYRHAQGVAAPHAGIHFSPDVQSDLMEWIPRQADWLNEFRTQILSVTGQRIPDTILVIDETVQEGRAMLLSLSLLEALFPLAQALFMDGPYISWRETFAWCWLKMTQPAAHAEVARRTRQDSGDRWRIDNLLKTLAAGTEDVHHESFAFRYLDEDSECLQVLSEILPAATWLSMQVWIEAQIEAHFRTQTEHSDAASLFQQVRQVHPHDLAVKRVVRTLQRSGGITAAEAAAMFHMSTEKAVELLESMVASSDWQARYSDAPRIIRTRTRRGLVYHYEGQ